MSAGLLSVKRETPVLRRELVNRSHLLERLEQSSTAPVVLLSAPAGLGKTTLVCDWLRMTDLPAAWLTLDGADNDPIHFLANLTASLQTIAPAIGRVASSMRGSPQAPPLDRHMAALINDAGIIGNHFAYILGAFHSAAERLCAESDQSRPARGCRRRCGVPGGRSRLFLRCSEARSQPCSAGSVGCRLVRHRHAR